MKTGKWYVIGFLAAMLTASGAALAHDMDMGGKDGWSGMHGHHMMCHKPSSITGDHAKLCHEAMASAFKKNEALSKRAHALHEKMHAVLSAGKFDKKQFLSLCGQMDKLRGEMMRNHAEAFAAIAGKLTPEERQSMMHMFHEHFMGGTEDHHGADAAYGNLNK